MRKIDLLAGAALVAGAFAVGQPALAAGDQPAAQPGAAQRGDDTTLYGDERLQGETTDTGMMLSDAESQAEEARELLRDAAEVVRQMKADPDAAALLRRAEGVFVVPEYAKGALIAGARGGEGVMLAKRDGRWGAPLFYEMGSVSIGAQAGFTAGSVAMILMNEKAVESFRQENNWSIDAGADLVVVDYSAMATAAGGKGDVALWSDAEGAFVGADISVEDIVFDDDETQAYYGRAVTPSQAFEDPDELEQAASPLEQALSG